MVISCVYNVSYS